MFNYEIIEDLMNIKESVKVHCLLMEYLKCQIAISRKPYKIIWCGFFGIYFLSAMPLRFNKIKNQLGMCFILWK